MSIGSPTNPGKHRRMIELKSFACHSCHQQCQHSFEKGRAAYIGICRLCGALACGKCRRRSPLNCALCSTESAFQYCPEVFNSLCYLLSFAPQDELKLLNFASWSPWACTKCCSPITTNKRLGLVELADDGVVKMLCCACAPNRVSAGKPLVTLFMKIIQELRTLFDERPHSGKKIQMISLNCGVCKKTSALDFLSERGDLICGKCTPPTYDIRYATRSALFYFKSFIHSIPDLSDLKLLNYSEWTPLRCIDCRIPFSNEGQYSMFHPNCYQLVCKACVPTHQCDKHISPVIPLKFLMEAIDEFRRLFKNGELECRTKDDVSMNRNALRIRDANSHMLHETDVTYFNNDLVAVSPLDLLESSILQKMPKCQMCDRSKRQNKLHTCLTCQVYGLCSQCVIGSHWGHTIEKTGQEILAAFIHNEHNKTVEDLVEWKDRIEELHNEGGEILHKLCDSYKNLFTTSLRCEDPRLVQAAISKANVQQLKNSVTKFVSSQLKMNNETKLFFDKVESVVEELIKEARMETATPVSSKEVLDE